MLAPKGQFMVRIMRHGRLLEAMYEPNLIVNLSKQTHAKLLGGSFTGNNVSQIGFGTSLTAADVGNTTLTGAYVKAIDSVTYPASNQVQFNFSLAGTEANGLAIGEFGLITASGVLYARKVRSAVLSKDSDISLSGNWVISF